MRSFGSALMAVVLAVGMGAAHADDAAGAKTYAVDITVYADGKRSLTDKLVVEGNSVQLETLKKLGYSSVKLEKTQVRDMVRLKLPSGDGKLQTFHAVLKADGTTEGNFVVLDEKRNKHTHQFKGSLAK